MGTSRRGRLMLCMRTNRQISDKKTKMSPGKYSPGIFLLEQLAKK